MYLLNNMGIIRFFGWMKNNFSKHIKPLKKGENFEDYNLHIDNLMIDMNGIFHNSAQKVYEYGNYQKPKSLLRPYRKSNRNSKIKQEAFFQDVCRTIEDIFRTSKPRKRLIMCVDGSAPQAKSNQQRSRRFRSVNDKSDVDMTNFDTNSLSVGTQLMDYLSKYIDWYIKKRISEDEEWQQIEVIFSSEKVPEEGEQKITKYIREFGNPDDTFVIHGLDGDIVMLALATHMPNFYILRDDLYDGNAFYIINIGEIRKQLIEMMRFEHSDFNSTTVINDFVFIGYLVGNDFIPHVPSIEILEDGFDIMINVYTQTCSSHGHLTSNINGKIIMNTNALQRFMTLISEYEQSNLERKMKHKSSFFTDTQLEKHYKLKNTSQSGQNVFELDIENYRQTYMLENFQSPSDKIMTEREICHHYLDGMQWVLTYYTTGITDWSWSYKFYYAPFAYHIATHLKSYTFRKNGYTDPLTPFQQLLSILPPKSSYLLPQPIGILLTHDESPLKKFCPDTITIDLAGKRKEWEGIPIVPMIDRNLVKKCFYDMSSKIHPKELHRNKFGKSYTYRFDSSSAYHFKSYYGDIKNCSVKISIINL